MSIVELHYPVFGDGLPVDHGYALYGALSRIVPSLHDISAPVSVGPIQGTYVGDKRLTLEPRRSRLRLRLPKDDIAMMLPLAGKSLDADGHRIRLGVPQVRALIPSSALMARVVLIKGFTEPESFLAACRRQLDDLNVQGEVGIPLVPRGAHNGKPCRRIVRIKDKRVVGFAVRITGLTAQESLTVQENGVGGRRKMGCGFFVAMREEDR